MNSFILTASAQNQTGFIKGKVEDNRTKELLSGANILIMGTTAGVSTDAKGEFIIHNVPVGSYSLRFSFIGYETIIKTDVVIRPGRVTFVNVELNPIPLESNEILVTSGYFQNKDIGSINAVGFNVEEIKRSPGSMGDVSRILLSLPGTAKISDDQNDLAVRGGSPIENVFYVDGIPIPNINHFPTIGSTGGPIGILNVDFIDNVNFLTSGFAPKYSDRLSSVVDIQYREGNRNNFEMQADLNISGFGGGAEGPLLNNKGSWMISGKRSYLDLIMDLFFKTGAMPRLSDIQGKIVYDINMEHKLSFIDIFAHNSEDFNKQDAIDLDSDNYGFIENLQNTAGLSWRALWNLNLYSVSSFSHSIITFENEFYRVSNGLMDYKGKNIEKYTYLRNINFAQLSPLHRIEFGCDLKNELGKYNYVKTSDTTHLAVVKPDFIINKKLNLMKLGLFFNYIINPLDKVTFSAGIRYDYYSLSKENSFSPRYAISYEINPAFRIFANGGIFFQQLPMILLSQNEKFEKLINSRAIHYGIGLDYLLTEDTKLTLEFYDKEYSRLPLDISDPTRSVIDDGLTNNDFGNYLSLENAGKAFTRGVELLIQKKLAKDIYGLISGSIFKSRYQGYDGIWRNRVYDNQYIFSVIGGYKPNEEWEYSARWTYAGGCPYTPFNIEKSIQAKRGIIDESKVNSERFPAYHSLSLRVDKKFYFKKQSLDIYVSLWNVYDRKNISFYSWDAEKNSIKPITQWGILPIIGIEYEF